MLTKKCVQLYRLGFVVQQCFRKLNNRYSDCKNVKWFAKWVRAQTTAVFFFGTLRYACVAHTRAMDYVEKTAGNAIYTEFNANCSRIRISMHGVNAIQGIRCAHLRKNEKKKNHASQPKKIKLTRIV